MEKEVLKSGSMLYLDLAPISVSFRLFQAIVQEFKRNGISIKIDLETELSLKEIFIENAADCLSGLADIVTSDRVVDCIMYCATKCLYETRGGVKRKITFDLFDEESCRGDFFEVMYKIAVRNLKPFFPQAPIE